MVVKTKRKNSFRHFFILKGRIIMKTTIKHIIKNPIQHIMKCTTIVFLAAAMVLCMVACAATEEPVTTTPATEAPVAAALAPTEPAETKPAFVPERYEPTLPPEPTVPETEPTEPVEDEDDYYYEDSYYEETYYEDSYYQEEPSCYVPEGEEPEIVVKHWEGVTVVNVKDLPYPDVTYDYVAAGNYGDAYAASTYGWIVDYSLNADNAGYYPACSISVQYALDNGGQDFINAKMAEAVDATAWGMSGPCYVCCDCWMDSGWIFFQVYYG